MLAALPPIAGNTPTTSPINDAQSRTKGRVRISHITFTWLTARLSFCAASVCNCCSEPSFSMSLMICAKAKVPIRTGKKGIPPSRVGMPKVSLSLPITGSLPNTVTTRPSPPAIKPLTMDDSTSPATIESARIKSEKYSQGPNSSARRASGPVLATKTTAPSKPPMSEA